MASVNFSDLKGKTLISIDGAVKESSRITFICDTGEEYVLYYDARCCEDVSIEDIAGEILDVIGYELLLAEMVKNHNQVGDTWCFYKLSTIRGSITIRWFSEENYYSDEADFARIK